MNTFLHEENCFDLIVQSKLKIYHLQIFKNTRKSSIQNWTVKKQTFQSFPDIFCSTCFLYFRFSFLFPSVASQIPKLQSIILVSLCEKDILSPLKNLWSSVKNQVTVFVWVLVALLLQIWLLFRGNIDSICWKQILVFQLFPSTTKNCLQYRHCAVDNCENHCC